MRLRVSRSTPVALALGGGAAKGIAHIGVLKALAEKGVRVGAVAGTSVGSLVGAAFCAGLGWEEILRAARGITWGDLVTLELPRRGLMRLDGLQRFLEKLLGNRTIEGLAIPFAAVATDLQTGSEVILTSGPLALAVKASCSVPGVFEPTVIDGQYLVDGGLVSDIPAKVARQLCPGTVIGVSLSAGAAREGVPRTLVDVISRSFEIFVRANSERSLEEADIAVAPRLEGFHYRDLARIDELVAAGEEATNLALAEPLQRGFRWPWSRRG